MNYFVDDYGKIHSTPHDGMYKPKRRVGKTEKEAWQKFQYLQESRNEKATEMWELCEKRINSDDP